MNNTRPEIKRLDVSLTPIPRKPKRKDPGHGQVLSVLTLFTPGFFSTFGDRGRRLRRFVYVTFKPFLIVTVCTYNLSHLSIV